MLGCQNTLAVCVPLRKVQLTARTFQLLARPSRAVLRCRPTSPRCARSYTAQTPANPQQASKHDLQETDPEHGIQQRPTASQASNKLAINTAGDLNPKIKKKSTKVQRDIRETGFRQYMRLVTHPVAIVTSADTGINSDGNVKTWRGATVSSFNSVTLDPEPYISFNIKKVSATYNAIKNSNLFAVHLMNNTAEAAQISKHFSRGNEASSLFLIDNSKSDARYQPYVRKSAYWSLPTELSPSSTLPPILQWQPDGGSRAVIFQTLCRYQADKTIEVGDHVIVIGKVIFTKGELDNTAEETVQPHPITENCLTYARGKYSVPQTEISSIRTLRPLWKAAVGKKDNPQEADNPDASIRSKIHRVSTKYRRVLSRSSLEPSQD